MHTSLGPKLRELTQRREGVELEAVALEQLPTLECADWSALAPARPHKRVRRPQTIDESAMRLRDAAPNPGHVFKYLVRQLGAEGFCGALPRHAGHAGKVAWWPSARPRPAESQELPSGPWFHAYTHKKRQRV